MTCAKRIVICVIQALDGTVVIGRNDCTHPQPTCPRADGEGYGKCIAVCGQQGHAEIQALRTAHALNVNVAGAHAYLVGHHYACEDCCLALNRAGVAAITILQNVELDVIRELVRQATR